MARDNKIGEYYRSNITDTVIENEFHNKYGEKLGDALMGNMRKRLIRAEFEASKAKQVRVKLDQNAMMFQHIVSPTETTSYIFNEVYSTKGYTIARITPLANKHEYVQNILNELIEGKRTSHGAIKAIQDWKAKQKKLNTLAYQAGSL